MLLDYHWHTKRCGHARDEMKDYILAARVRGLKEVGFADHIYLYWLPPEKRDPGLAMAEKEMPEYIAEINRLQREYPDMKIRIGLEVDYIPGWEAEVSKILKKLPLDYVLGSVHYIDDWGFDNPDLLAEYDKRDIEATYRQYFKLVQQAAASGLFDVIAHADLIKKFGYRPRSKLARLYEQTARIFKEADVCVEINTAGLRVPAQEIYPSAEFLNYCLKYEVPVTLGSDAHTPEQAGYGLEQALKLIKAIGYKDVAMFSSRKRHLVGIK